VHTNPHVSPGLPRPETRGGERESASARAAQRASNMARVAAAEDGLRLSFSPGGAPAKPGLRASGDDLPDFLRDAPGAGFRDADALEKSPDDDDRALFRTAAPGVAGTGGRGVARNRYYLRNPPSELFPFGVCKLE